MMEIFTVAHFWRCDPIVVCGWPMPKFTDAQEYMHIAQALAKHEEDPENELSPELEYWTRDAR